MKRRIILSLVTLTLLFVSNAIVYRVNALPGNSMWIDPSNLSFDTATTSVGTKFNVTVWLNVTTPANAWQCYVIYNKAQLNNTASWLTGTGNTKSQWSGALPTDNPAPATGNHNATHGYTFWGEVLKNGAEKAGLGTLVILEFQILQAPGTGKTLASEIHIDVNGLFETAVFDKDFNPLSLTYGNATYTYSDRVPPPPPATILINPSIIQNRSLTPCHNFTINVQIENAITVSLFEFKLNFNGTIINARTATLGSFFPPTATRTVEINNASGYIKFSASLGISDPPVSGAGVLAAIVFHVEANGSTSLRLSEIQLKSDQGQDLPFDIRESFFSNTVLVGDLNGDGKVDIFDVARVSAAFGTYPGHRRWDPNADIDRNGRIDVLDVALVCLNFGRLG